MQTLRVKDMQLISKVQVENPDTVTSLSRMLVTLQKLQSLFIMNLSTYILKAAVTASSDSLPSPNAPS